MKLYRSKKAEQRIMATYDQLLALWNVEKEEKDIVTTYGTTHVILCGEEANPPLVLLHGVGDDSALMWIYNAQALARHFRIIAIDTLGGPGKSRPNGNYNKTFDAAKWLDEVLAGLALDRVHLAGVSNGAYLAQSYGLHRPEKVIRLVSMAGSVPVSEFIPLKVMMKIFLPEALFPTKKNTVKLIRKLCGKNSRVFTDRPIIMEHYQYLLKGFNNMAMRYHKLTNFSEEEVASIRDKTLYLVGEDDPFAKLGGKNALLIHRMNARFFPEVGHGINHEIADTIHSLLIEYLLSETGEPKVSSII